MQRPNFLFLMADHARGRALSPGSPCIAPNLRYLAHEGVQFGRCYTTNAICSPSRASLMTGTYPSTHGVWDCTHTQQEGWVNMLLGQDSFFSNKLSEKGYMNGYFGKWHVTGSGDLGKYGWHEYDCTSGLRKAEPSELGRVSVPREGYRDYLLAGVDESGGPLAHPAIEGGIDFIRRAAKEKNPFCCFVSAAEPHDPYIPPPVFLNKYDIHNLQTSPTLRREPEGKPEIVKRMRAVWRGLSDDDWRRIAGCYYAVISYLDFEMGRVIGALKESGCYDNTVIVFTSDHGDMLGSHGLAAKGVGTAYEEVYNVPLIMRVPGAGGGRLENKKIASLVDIAPTVLELAGAGSVNGMQGRSLVPVLNGEDEPEERDEAYAEFYGQRFVYTQRILWKGDWKYVFSPGGVDELYHLGRDPYECFNLAAENSCEDIIRQMCGRMWKKAKKIGDKSFFNTHYATLRTAPVGPGAAD